MPIRIQRSFPQSYSLDCDLVSNQTPPAGRRAAGISARGSPAAIRAGMERPGRVLGLPTDFA